jgi:hypothetical protein
MTTGIGVIFQGVVTHFAMRGRPAHQHELMREEINGANNGILPWVADTQAMTNGIGSSRCRAEGTKWNVA